MGSVHYLSKSQLSSGQKLILKFTWKFEGFRVTKKILEKKLEGSHISQFQNLLQSMVIQTVWYCLLG